VTCAVRRPARASGGASQGAPVNARTDARPARQRLHACALTLRARCRVGALLDGSSGRAGSEAHPPRARCADGLGLLSLAFTSRELAGVTARARGCGLSPGRVVVIVIVVGVLFLSSARGSKKRKPAPRAGIRARKRQRPPSGGLSQLAHEAATASLLKMGRQCLVLDTAPSNMIWTHRGPWVRACSAQQVGVRRSSRPV
jgi:hypothetical protein